MASSPADAQGVPHPATRRPEHDGEQRLENAPTLMPDLRRDAVEHGQDPEEVDPVTLDEDALRRMSSTVGDDAL